MPTGGRSCWRAAASWRRCGDWFRAPRLSRGRDPGAAGLPGQRDPPACLRHRACRPRRPARPRSISTPRRNSPARSCWPRASRKSSPSPACSATASAAPLHHPEFTMLEWYRANEPYEALMADCAAILAECAEGRRLRAIALARPCRRSLRRARATHGRRRIRAIRRHRPAFDADAGRAGPRQRSQPRRARQAFASLPTTPGPTCSAACWSSGSSRSSAAAGPTLLDQYPLPEAALAQPAADPRLTQRFELYACGVELANGFGELTDIAEQRRRFEAAMAEKERRYGERYPIDPDFLSALAECRRRAGSRSASTGW